MGNCLLTKGKESLQMDLLWTNPDPNSAFTPQTISLDLSSYSMVYIVFKISSDAGYTLLGGSLGLKRDTLNDTDNTFVFGIQNNTAGSGFVYYAQRNYGVSSSGIIFSIGMNAFSGATQNNYGIPYQIYGIKQFKFIQKYVSGLQGIDTNNVIYNKDGSSNITYTATQDCYLTVDANAEWVKLNGVFILNDSGINANFYGIIPLKSGQVITTGGTVTGHRCDRFRVYGILGE